MRARLLLAAAFVLGLLVAPVAIAGATGDSDGVKARASASVKKQIKKLQQELADLEQQIDSSEGAPAPPTGQAGGDLNGSYPNPSIGSNTVGSGQVIANSLKGADIDDDSLDAGVLQRRVADNCPPGESIRAIDPSGANVTCETVGGGGNPTGSAGGDLAGSSYPNPEIAPDAVGGPEIAANAVGTAEVAPDSLAAGDLAPDSVNTSEIATSGVASAEVADNALIAGDLALDSVTSSEIDTSAVGSIEVASNSLDRTDINEADLEGVGSAAALENGTDDLTPGELGQFTGAPFASPCDPSVAFLSCGAITLNLPAAGSVLIQGSGGFVGVASGEDTGTCEIREGATTLGGNMTFGQAGAEHNASDRADGFAMSAFDTGNAAGDHTYTFVCNETAGDVQIHDPKMSAIYLF